MKTKAQLTIWTMFVIFSLCLSLLNVNTVHADDAPPTEPPAATEEATEPATEENNTIPADVSETPTPPASDLPEDAPAMDEEASVEEVLSEIPDNTEVVVLDENGNPIPLASQDAINIIQEEDPLWCPVGAPLNSPLCRNFTGGSAISNMLTDMRNNTSTYDENGVIYFTSTAGGSLALTNAGGSLSTDFALLRNFNLTLVGGWNGNLSSPVFSGQTSFGSNSLTIGTTGNPWVGSITLNNFVFSGVSSTNAVTIYTTNGDITLNNVDVAQQAGGNYTALLDSNTGDITVQNGSSFDGNNSGNNQNRGFSAETNTGSITITNTTFDEARGCLNLFIICVDALVNYNGATLSAPIVGLTNVTANNNDLSGIRINNADLITLNNVVATNNGTILVGSGVYIDGTGSTVVNVTGGTFSNNEPYGIYLDGISALNYLSPPTCAGNLLPLAIIDPNNCDNIADTTPPVLSLPGNLTVEAASSSGAIVNFSATANDDVDGSRPVSCSPISGSTFAITTTTVNCSASDQSNNTSTGSFTVTVQDATAPVIALHADVTEEATSASGNVVTYTSPSTSDAVDGAGTASCLPASGSTFTLGSTTVTCNAMDSHNNTAIPTTFTVNIVDSTPPTIAPHADILVATTNPSGALVSYSAPATFDIVDGAGVATCTPPSGSKFPHGETSVVCTAMDSHGNSASSASFIIKVDESTVSAATTSGFFIPVTGGTSVKLNCVAPDSFKVSLAGALVIFNNLCGYEAFINNLQQPELPGEMTTSGFEFIDGYSINIIENGDIVNPLPKDASIAIEFNTPNDIKGADFAVLYWNGTQWIEVSGEKTNDNHFLANITAEMANSNTFIFVTK